MRVIDADKLIKSLVSAQMEACMLDDMETAKTIQLAINEVLKQPTIKPIRDLFDKLTEEGNKKAYSKTQKLDWMMGFWNATEIVDEEMKKYD